MSRRLSHNGSKSDFRSDRVKRVPGNCSAALVNGPCLREPLKGFGLASGPAAHNCVWTSVYLSVAPENTRGVRRAATCSLQCCLEASLSTGELAFFLFFVLVFSLARMCCCWPFIFASLRIVCSREIIARTCFGTINVDADSIVECCCATTTECSEHPNRSGRARATV